MNTPHIDTEPGAEAGAFERRPPTGYHRSHRRVALSRRIILGGAVTLAAVLFLLALKILFMPELTLQASRLLGDLLGEHLPGCFSAGIPLWGAQVLTVLCAQPEVPSTTLCAVILGAAAASFALLHRLPLARPAVVAINLFFFMAAFHAALFLLIPGRFNSSALGLAEFFMEISLVTGLTLPVLFWLIVFPLPAGTVWKLLHLLGFEAVLIVLFLLKYAVFLLLCAKGTYLVVPFIVFFLCSLPDIIYMIAVFSLMVARVSRSAAKDIRVWLWA